jgi:hypothetical protein
MLWSEFDNITLFPTCYSGQMQSPINLNPTVATENNPGQVIYNQYSATLPSFASQLLDSALGYNLALWILHFTQSSDLPTISGGPLLDNNK